MAATDKPIPQRNKGGASAGSADKPANGDGYAGQTIDLGNDVYTHEGRRFGPGNVEIKTGNPDEDDRIISDLTGAVERVQKETKSRMQGLENQGIINPTPAPVHNIIEPPPGGQSNEGNDGNGQG